MSKWLWILISGLVWPALQYGWGVLRFGAGNPETGYMQALQDFGLMGLVAGWLFFFMRERTSNPRQNRFVMLGYLAATPFALAGMLGGGLFLPTIVGAAVFGSIPLIVGGWLGSLVGGMGPAG